MVVATRPRIRSLKLAPDLMQLAEGRRFISDVATEAGFSRARVFDIMVACSEGMANAVEHAAGREQIVVETRTYPDRLEVSVLGTGEFEMPNRSAQREHRGLGLPLMAKLSDHLALYSAPQGGTLLTLTFYREGHDQLSVQSPLPPALLELLEGTDLLQSLLDTVPGAFGIVDAELRWLYLNETARAEDGREENELIGHPVDEGRPDLVESGFVAFLERARAADTPLREDIYNPSRGRWSEITAFPFGEGVAYFRMDIGERKRAEELLKQRTTELEEANDRLRAEMAEHAADEKALKESREKYQQLIETNVDFVWEIDAEGRYTYCSPQMEKLWGLKPEEMLGRTPFELMPPEDRERAESRFREIVNSRQSFIGLRMRSYDAEGHITHMESSGVPYFDENGSLVGYRGTTRDVTSGVLAAEAEERYKEQLENEVMERTAELRASRELLDAILQAQAVSLCVYRATRDEAGNIVDLECTFANPVTEQVASGLDLVGRKYSEMFPFLERQRVLDSFVRVIETGEPLDREFRYSGGTRSGWFRCIAVKLGDGLVLNIEDITLRKQAEDEGEHKQEAH